MGAASRAPIRMSSKLIILISQLIIRLYAGQTTRSKRCRRCAFRSKLGHYPQPSLVDCSSPFLYDFNVYKWVILMARPAIESNSRMSLRIRAEEKTLLLRAVALQHTDLTDFVVKHALRAAKNVIEKAEQVQLS